MATETTSASGMPQLDFSTFSNQIFWLCITLVILYFILSRIALPRIANVLAERSGAIQHDLDKAEELKLKAIKSEEAYNKALNEARTQAHDIIAETKVSIQKELDKAVRKADEEISAKVAESEKMINEIRKNANGSIKDIATSITQDIVAKISPSAIDDKALKTAILERLKG